MKVYEGYMGVYKVYEGIWRYTPSLLPLPPLPPSPSLSPPFSLSLIPVSSLASSPLPLTLSLPPPHAPSLSPRKLPFVSSPPLSPSPSRRANRWCRENQRTCKGHGCDEAAPGCEIYQRKLENQLSGVLYHHGCMIFVLFRFYFDLRSNPLCGSSPCAR